MANDDTSQRDSDDKPSVTPHSSVGPGHLLAVDARGREYISQDYALEISSSKRRDDTIVTTRMVTLAISAIASLYILWEDGTAQEHGRRYVPPDIIVAIIAGSFCGTTIGSFAKIFKKRQ